MRSRRRASLTKKVPTRIQFTTKKENYTSLQSDMTEDTLLIDGLCALAANLENSLPKDE